ncbi:MAG: hypothetical protein ACI9Z3_001843, partial [Roseivirga sp.]
AVEMTTISSVSGAWHDVRKQARTTKSRLSVIFFMGF